MSSLDEPIEWERVEGLPRDQAYAFLAGVADVLTAAFWREKDHPRDKDGKFTDGSLSGGDVFSAIPQSDWEYTTKVGGIRAGEIQSGLDLYGTGYFTKINGELRVKKGKVGKLEGKPGAEPGQINSTQTLQNKVKAMDIGMEHSKLTEPISVIRVIRDPASIFGKSWKKDGDNAGLKWKDDGFVSTTPDEDYARHYASGSENVRMNLLVQAGTGAMKLFQTDPDRDDAPERRQVVLDRGLTFRVVRDNGIVDGLRQLDVEVRNG